MKELGKSVDATWN